MKAYLLVGAAIGLLGFSVPALGAPEPFGQETVETRPLRNPQAKPAASTHAGHVTATDAPAMRTIGATRMPRRRARARPSARHRPFAWRTIGMALPVTRTGANGHDHGLETENLFGFTLGSDTERGARGIALETVGRFGKRDGTYAGISKKLEFSYGVTDDISVALGPLRRLSPRRSASPASTTSRDSISTASAPSCAGAWSRRAPDATGDAAHRTERPAGRRANRIARNQARLRKQAHLRPRTGHGSSCSPPSTSSTNSSACARTAVPTGRTDRRSELRPPPASRSRQSSSSGVRCATCAPTKGCAADHLPRRGGVCRPDAVLALRVRMPGSRRAWNVQVAGHEAGNPRRLDLTNFERHQARVKVGVEF